MEVPYVLQRVALSGSSLPYKFGHSLSRVYSTALYYSTISYICLLHSSVLQYYIIYMFTTQQCITVLYHIYVYYTAVYYSTISYIYLQSSSVLHYYIIYMLTKQQCITISHHMSILLVGLIKQNIQLLQKKP